MSRSLPRIALTVPFALAAITIGVVPSTRAEAQTFRRPFACDACISNFFYFDEDATTAAGDWSCGTSSYDGHRGSDFSLRGGLASIDAGNDVVAGADGVVLSVQDGHFDRCTSCGGSGCGLDFGFGFGNHAVIDHGSYKVVYAHMRTGSLRVAPGDRVTCGQALGQIGSSGCSTGAHLHFETRPTGGGYMTAFDPFAGSCSATSPSLWVEQGPHRGIPGAACSAVPTEDAGTPDASTPDASAPDASTLDASTLDASTLDGGTRDGGTADAGAMTDGAIRRDTALAGGCGCRATTATGGDATLAIGLLVLGTLGARRRRA